MWKNYISVLKRSYYYRKKLEEIVNSLENEDVSLEDFMKAYVRFYQLKDDFTIILKDAKMKKN